MDNSTIHFHMVIQMPLPLVSFIFSFQTDKRATQWWKRLTATSRPSDAQSPHCAPWKTDTCATTQIRRKRGGKCACVNALKDSHGGVAAAHTPPASPEKLPLSAPWTEAPLPPGCSHSQVSWRCSRSHTFHCHAPYVSFQRGIQEQLDAYSKFRFPVADDRRRVDRGGFWHFSEIERPFSRAQFTSERIRQRGSAGLTPSLIQPSVWFCLLRVFLEHLQHVAWTPGVKLSKHWEFPPLQFRPR